MINANCYFVKVQVRRGAVEDTHLLQVNQINHINLSSNIVHMNNGELLTLTEDSMQYVVKVLEDVFVIQEAD